MSEKMVNCPLGSRCETVGKKHESNSRILRQHTEQAKRDGAYKTAPGPNLAPKAVSGLTSDDDLERYEEFMDEAGVDFWVDDYKGVVMVREDGRQFDMSKLVAEDFAGGPSDSPAFATALISALDNYREYTGNDTVMEAVDYAIESTGANVGRNAIANVVANGRNVAAAEDFMANDPIEMARWHQDAIDEAREAGSYDAERRLGIKVLDEAQNRRGIKIDSVDYDKESDRTSVSLSDPNGKTYEFTSAKHIVSSGKKTPEEIVGRAVAMRQMMTTIGGSVNEFSKISENEAGEYMLANAQAGRDYFSVYRKAYIRSRQITGMRQRAKDFLG